MPQVRHGDEEKEGLEDGRQSAWRHWGDEPRPDSTSERPENPSGSVTAALDLAGWMDRALTAERLFEDWRLSHGLWVEESGKWQKRCLAAEALLKERDATIRDGSWRHGAIDQDPWKEAERLRSELADVRNELQQVTEGKVRRLEEELAEAKLTADRLAEQHENMRKELRQAWTANVRAGNIIRRARQIILSLPSADSIRTMVDSMDACTKSQ